MTLHQTNAIRSVGARDFGGREKESMRSRSFHSLICFRCGAEVLCCGEKRDDKGTEVFIVAFSLDSEDFVVLLFFCLRDAPKCI